ncbi:hypothetical protein ACQPX6_19580 [Actinomycetospora sp. CA-101289]|uniref:hypothetical protein n=1 Tax=Actinomycetospora sp. CA-101289 TaxID=3239893 RepID=UPI003D953A2A
MTHHPSPVVPSGPQAHALRAVADVLDLVGEAVAATTICLGAALGAALPPARRVRVVARGAVPLRVLEGGARGVGPAR